MSERKNRRIRFVENRDVYALKLVDAEAGDAGVYSCTAQNSAGQARSECFLAVANVTGDDQHLVTVMVDDKEQAERPKFVRKPPPELKLYEGKFVNNMLISKT